LLAAVAVRVVLGAAIFLLDVFTAVAAVFSLLLLLLSLLLLLLLSLLQASLHRQYLHPPVYLA
jgi:hypothetical protein